MAARGVVVIGQVAAVAASAAVLAAARAWPLGAGLAPEQALAYAVAPAGVLMAAMIGHLALRRLFDSAHLDGTPFAPGSPRQIDQRVLSNTVEQMVLMLCLWPLIAFGLGAPLVLWLGLSFVLGRAAFWLGYRLRPPMRGFGFGLGAYPTVAALVWALWRLAWG